MTQQGAILKSGSFIPFDPQGSANSVFGFDLQNAQPAIVLHDASGAVFTPRRDLLSSSGSATDFVVEVEDDKTYLRFGDGVFGKAPASALFASYRVGNGRAGNVGAEALSHLVSFSLPNGQPAPWLSGVRSLRNPMPAQGGTDPQTVAEVRMYAPQAFKLQERAVTLADYAAVAGLYPQVQGVQVTRRFTGSFYTIVLCVQRQGMLPLDDAFQSGLRAFLDDYRMVGQDLQITAPSGVPIALDLIVNAAPNAVRSDVRDAVLSAIGSTRRDAAAGGFFDPNRCTLGQPIYLSQLVNRIMQVTGVEWVEVDFFGLYGGPNLLQSGVLALMPQEMPLLDNDPSTPLRGVLDLSVQGGV